MAPDLPNLLLVWHLLFNCNLLSSQIVLHGQCPTQRGFGQAGASQAFFWYDNKKDLKACFSLTWFNRNEERTNTENQLNFAAVNFCVLAIFGDIKGFSLYNAI